MASLLSALYQGNHSLTSIIHNPVLSTLALFYVNDPDL